MPRLPDKLLLNCGVLLSFLAIIKGWFKGIHGVMDVSEKLAWEIEKNGWSDDPQAQEMLKQQVFDCAEVDDACKTFVKALNKFHAKQIDRADNMRVFIDKKMAQPPPVTP